MNYEYLHFPFDLTKLTGLNTLFQAAWGDQAQQVLGSLQLNELLKWRYQQNPAGQARQFVAIDQQQWVGHVGIEPLRLKVGPRQILAFQAGHVLVAKDYQGKWLFSQLAKQMHDYLAGQGEYLLLGFPNKAAFPVWRRQKWQDFVKIPTLASPLRWGPLLKLKAPAFSFLKYPLDLFSTWLRLATRRCPPKDFTIEPVSKVGTEFDQLWQETERQFPVAAIRDAKYLNWRYFSAPKSKHYTLLACRDQAGKLIGYLVFLQGTLFDVPALIIMDFLVAPGFNVLPALISAAIDHGVKNGAALALTIVPKDSAYYSSFLWGGFLPLPEQLLIKSMVLSGKTNLPEPSSSLIANPVSWHVTFGDWDGL